jgi:hypothetical protein
MRRYGRWINYHTEQRRAEADDKSARGRDHGKGPDLFARIDHAAGAAQVDLSLRPTKLLIFGSARAILLARRPNLERSLPGLQISRRIELMPTVRTKAGVEIFFKDWGSGQPIVFSHGWPLSSDDWDPQMLFFLNKGYRVIAHDRRGHGRSTQVGDGHDLDHYADDLAAVIQHLDLKNAIHIGHSTGGGEVVRYLARHGESRASKAAIISAVPPLMVKTPGHPGGLPKSVFDDLQSQLDPRPGRPATSIRCLVLDHCQGTSTWGRLCMMVS